MTHPRHADLLTAHAITLHNPWAHLVAHYGKNVENRSWMPQEQVTTLLIHAGKTWDDAADAVTRPMGDLGDVTPSAIVAVADLAFACNTSRWVGGIQCDCGPWAAPGQCHWNLTSVRALPEPVPCGGRQGLWRPAPDVLAAVIAQLASTTARGTP